MHVSMLNTIDQGFIQERDIRLEAYKLGYVCVEYRDNCRKSPKSYLKLTFWAYKIHTLVTLGVFNSSPV